MEKDKKGGLAKTHKQSASVVHDALTEFGIVDIWRTFVRTAEGTPGDDKLLKFIVESISLW